MTDRSFKATVPCDITFRDGIGTMLHAICHGANEKVMFEVVSAYNEAFNNVVHHSKLPDDAPVVVEVSRRGDELTIRIEDQGIGYEVDHNPDDDVIASLPDGGAALVGDRRHVSFMYSYPNLMPLPQPQVRDLRRRLQGLSFDSVYGFNRGRNLLGGAQAAVDASFERYLRALDGAAAIEVAA